MQGEMVGKGQIRLYGACLYLHDDEKVKDQDEWSKKRSGDLIAGQKPTVQIIPSDPVRTDDQNHHRRQRDQHRPENNNNDPYKWSQVRITPLTLNVKHQRATHPTSILLQTPTSIYSS